MKIIQVQAIGSPRQVTTKFGAKTVLDTRTDDYQTITLWRKAQDPALASVVDGTRLHVAIDSQGKAQLIETPADQESQPLALPFEAEQQLKKQMGFTAEPPPSRGAEIVDYVGRLTKLYKHCFKSVTTEMGDSGLEIEELKDISTTVFIQTAKHFNL